jgi:hypothetical protein
MELALCPVYDQLSFEVLVQAQWESVEYPQAPVPEIGPLN